MQTKKYLIMVVAIVFLLLVPFIASQFTDEVAWSIVDYLVAGVLLLVTALMCDLVLRKVHKLPYRIAICLAILVVVILIWAELAVGIFGTPFGGT